MRILGIDPGGTTGIVVIDVAWDENRYEPTPDAYRFDAQIEARWDAGSDSVGSQMFDLIHDNDPDLIVIEKFIITQRTARFSQQPDAMWIIGGVRFLADISSIPVHMQPASLAKTTWDNERLKETGWFKVVKQPHARDALRHALTSCVTYKPGVASST